MPRSRRNPDLHPALLAADGTRYFSDAALAEADHEGGAYKSRTALVLMDPSDFIRMAMPGTKDESVVLVDRLMREGTRFKDVPRLFVSYDKETGVAEVTGHEGRHRSRALLARGVRQMPVRIHTNKLRWSEQSRPSSWDYVKVLPHTLIGEDANRVNRMPMPIPIHYPELETRMRKQNPRRNPHPAFGYHGTSADALADLLRDGLRAEKGYADKKVYFAERASDAMEYLGRAPLLLRFPWPADARRSGDGWSWATSRIPAEEIEVWFGSGEAGDDPYDDEGWAPLTRESARAYRSLLGLPKTNPAPRVPRGFRDLAAWSKWADGQGVDLRLLRTPYGGVEITDLFAHTTGTGAGTRVVAALVSAADTAGMPLVLEPSSRRNITFYERFGFAVSPRGTAMIRSPRSR
jgi:hypothetical protein